VAIMLAVRPAPKPPSFLNPSNSASASTSPGSR
jgi:hypothetical protein